uniref:Uncharacterized protein n=1 Tax=Ciona intestinalis TaxID=7719 RepID=H2Y321_CIOIN
MPYQRPIVGKGEDHPSNLPQNLTYVDLDLGLMYQPCS